MRKALLLVLMALMIGMLSGCTIVTDRLGPTPGSSEEVNVNKKDDAITQGNNSNQSANQTNGEKNDNNSGTVVNNTGSSDKKEETKKEDQPTVVFSLQPGIYTKNQYLELMLPEGVTDAKIYYTVNGKEPDATSKEYKSKIKLEAQSGNYPKATVVHAKYITSTGEESKTVSGTYIVRADANRLFTTYVFSISGDPVQLTLAPNGIFSGTNYEVHGRESERPVYVEAFDKEGEQIISQSAGLRIYGAYSRRNYLKSVKIYAREEYDAANKNFKYNFFDTPALDGSDKLISKYKRLVLRNSGNDYQFAWIRDELNQTLAKQAGFDDYEAVAPAVFYLNGSYKGLYWLHEVFSDHYFMNKYGSKGKNGEFVILEGGDTFKNADADGEAEDIRLDYVEKYDYFKTLDYTKDSNYKKVNEWMDVENYLRYMAINIYVCNKDWPHNNYKCYRYVTDNKSEYEAGTVFDGRWRYLIHDMDYSMGLYDQSDDMANYDTLGTILSEKQYGENDRYSPLLNALLKRKECVEYFVNFTCTLTNGAYSPENVKKTLEEMNKERMTEIEYFYEYLAEIRDKKLGDIWVWRGNFEDFTSRIVTFANSRPNNSYNFMKNAFKLGHKMTFKFTMPIDIKVDINGLEVTNGKSCMYYEDFSHTIRLTEGADKVTFKINGRVVTGNEVVVTKADMDSNYKINIIIEK
ncbi:MAG: CotH kinase family protein [Lachnospiraceae bacterium]|nr:CotH kinase family protein [Lachnospiraceae bacterium]